MTRLTNVFVFVVAGFLVSEVTPFLWGRRSSSSITQQTSHFSTNNCMCLNKLFQMLNSLGNGGSVGKRDAAAFLNLDEDYPGLDEFMEHADMKRDGTVDSEEFKIAVRQAASNPSQSNSPNLCHCGRMVVDQFRRDL